MSDIITIVSIIVTVISIIIAAREVYGRTKFFNRISKRRQGALTGNWIGYFTEEVPGKKSFNQIKNNLVFTLEARSKTVKGKGKILPNEKNEKTFIFKGGFRHERFLVLDYYNPDEKVIQFGRLIFELSSNGKILRGSYVGYGSE
ncbi:MAG: hypothetical protein KDE33_26900, partial [Bacteroidetes bacterium]|nr:hypothetical protein [Bacteroidota bacterium]